MKKLILVYAGANQKASTEKAIQLRGGEYNAFSIDAVTFNGPEVCDKVVIMPDMPSWRRDKIAKAYGDKVCAPEAEPIIPVIDKRPRGRPRKSA